MNLKEQMKQIVAEVSGLEISALNDDIQVKDLKLDSLDFAQIAFSMEEKLDLKTNRQMLFKDIKNYTVGEFLDILVESIRKQEVEENKKNSE